MFMVDGALCEIDLVELQYGGAFCEIERAFSGYYLVLPSTFPLSFPNKIQAGKMHVFDC